MSGRWRADSVGREARVLHAFLIDGLRRGQLSPEGQEASEFSQDRGEACSCVWGAQFVCDEASVLHALLRITPRLGRLAPVVEDANNTHEAVD